MGCVLPCRRDGAAVRYWEPGSGNERRAIYLVPGTTSDAGAAGDDVIEVVVDAAALVRHSPDARLSMPRPRRLRRQERRVQLQRGYTWHHLTGGGYQPYRVRTPSVEATAHAGTTFMVTVEPDASCFVVVLEGAADVALRPDEPPVRLRASQAVVCQPGGGLSPVVDVADDELARDPWIARNRPLDAKTFAPAPELAPSRFVPRLVAAAGAVALGLLLVVIPHGDGRPITLVEERAPQARAQPSQLAPTANTTTPTALAPAAPPTTAATVPERAGQPATTVPVAPPTTVPVAPEPAEPPPAVTAALTTCQGSGAGTVALAGTLANGDGRAHRLVLEVSVSDGAGVTRGSGEVVVEVGPGQQETWQARLPRPAGGGGRCVLGDVTVAG